MIQLMMRISFREIGRKGPGFVTLHAMDLVALTRALIDIESVTGNERAVGEFLFEYLSRLGTVERMPVEG